MQGKAIGIVQAGYHIFLAGAVQVAPAYMVETGAAIGPVQLAVGVINGHIVGRAQAAYNHRFARAIVVAVGNVVFGAVAPVQALVYGIHHHASRALHISQNGCNACACKAAALNMIEAGASIAPKQGRGKEVENECVFGRCCYRRRYAA